jgi:hypothetical protein
VTTLFAALNVRDGTVLGRCMAQHRHQEFVRFLNAIERAVPAGKLIHAIADNYATHCVFRSIVNTHSGGSRTRIPFDPEHGFRLTMNTAMAVFMVGWVDFVSVPLTIINRG